MRIVHICSVDKMILHTRIPVIKATARMLKENAGTGQKEIISLPIDISIDSLAHRYESFLPFPPFIRSLCHWRVCENDRKSI